MSGLADHWRSREIHQPGRQEVAEFLTVSRQREQEFRQLGPQLELVLPPRELALEPAPQQLGLELELRQRVFPRRLQEQRQLSLPVLFWQRLS